MRSLLLLIVCWYTITDQVSAQVKKEKTSIVSVKNTVPNTFYKEIFTIYTDLEHVSVECIERQPVWLTLHFRSDSTENSYKEEFDLRFEGDRYSFTKKYRQPLPVLPDSQMADLLRMLPCDKKYGLKATINTDSVVYSLLQYDPPFTEGGVRPNSFLRIVAEYEGGVGQLARNFESAFIKSEHTVVNDSVFVFQFIVERDGMLSNVQLIIGESSPFSQFILQQLLGTGRPRRWRPATQGGTPIRATVKMYIRLNKDGSITVLQDGPYSY